MPTFSDVTHTFLSGLDKLSAYLSVTVSRLQGGDKQFRQHKDDLVGVPFTFSGLGANAFDQAVERNIARSSQFQFKMDALILATNHLKAQITSSNDKYDTDMAIPPGLFEFDMALNHYGYTELSVLTKMRDYVLGGLDMALLLDAGPGTCYSWLGVERDIIIADIQSQHDKHVQQAQDLYKLQLRNEGQPEDPYLKSNMNTTIQQEDTYLSEAKFVVSGRLYQQIHDAISGWFSEVTPALESYNEETGMATAINAVTVGQLIWELNNTPGHPPLIIYQTPNGGLMVLVGNNSINSQQINQAIKNYISANGLQGSNGQPVQITLMGYQSGGQVTQDLMAKFAANGIYHVENMLLVGAAFTMQNPPKDTNYDLYVSPGDKNAGDNSGSILPTNQYQWGNLGLNAVFNVGIGAATGGPVGAGWGVVSTVAGQGINVGTNIAQDNNNTTNISFADPNGYFGQGNQLVIHNYTNNATTNSGLTPYYSMDHTVPFEQGGEYSSNWGGLLGKTPHYDQSAYLDGAPVADPTATFKFDQPNPQGQVHVGSVMLQGPHPLSPPTYYSLKNGQLSPSS